VLGAGHAFLPGHGKTIMAAYLVGRRGRYRDVATVGATITLTHTAGVLLIGLLLSLSASLAPTQVVQDLAVLSGLIVAGVGLWLLVSAFRHRASVPIVREGAEPALEYAGASHSRTSAHPPEHDHNHDHTHGHDVPRHDHADDRAHAGFSRTGLVGLGVAGGLVPSPSALLVLLAAVALGRTTFGIVLVLGYGAGMAVAFIASGLLVVRLRGGVERILRTRSIDRLLTVLPVLTGLLVVIVGVGLVLRALSGTV
jgi:ABC-type nickel/cobalt efflux system permease component RcnA